MSDNKCLPDGVPFDQHGNPRKRYVRVGFDGSSCIVEPPEVADMLEDGAHQMGDVFLSVQEFEALPEFGGW